MKLSGCTHGKLVVKGQGSTEVMVGMVVGLSENCHNEAIPVVQWQDETTYPCHHSNLSLYEE